MPVNKSAICKMYDVGQNSSEIRPRKGYLSWFGGNWEKIRVCLQEPTFTHHNTTSVSYTHLTLPTKRIV